jgi:hypothetical protein
MKASLFATFAMLLSFASPAFATAGTTGHSGILVWIFIGFFALIVVAQLVPAFLVLMGVLGSFTARGQEKARQSR